MSPLFFIKGCDVLKKIKRSVMCIFLSGMLVFNGGYKSYVNAFSLAVIGTITLGEAILYCAATLGTVYVASEVYENADTLAFAGEQMLTDFKEWCADCTEYIDVTTREVEDWLGKVAEGTLDKGCEVWDAFKDYIASINVTQGEMVVNNQGTQTVTVTKEQMDMAFNKINKTMLKSALYKVPRFCAYLDKSQLGDYYVSETGSTVAVAIECTDGTQVTYITDAYRGNSNLIGAFGYGMRSGWYGDKENPYAYFDMCVYNSVVVEDCPSFGGVCGYFETYSSNLPYAPDYTIQVNCRWEDMYRAFDSVDKVYGRYLGALIMASGVVNGYWDFSIPIPDWGIADDVVIDDSVKEVLERDGTLDNVDVWGYGDMTLDKDDVLTIPWENVQPTDLSEPFVGGQTVAIDLVDGVTVDTDIPVEDIPVEPVVPRDSYTIPNLETVFPFCVPFDLVKIFTLFNAEPEAPHFTWKFYFWVGEMKTYDVEIDLSPFDSVAEILRLMELIGFMVFLTLKTRDLIRG